MNWIKPRGLENGRDSNIDGVDSIQEKREFSKTNLDADEIIALVPVGYRSGECEQILGVGLNDVFMVNFGNF